MTDSVLPIQTSSDPLMTSSSPSNGLVIPQQTIDLSGLRDIHTLPEPSYFPPAIGWWMVMGGILFIGIIFILWYKFYHLSGKRYALQLLRQIERRQLSTVGIGTQIGKLLKRVALACFPRNEVADLSGEKWAEFLYNHGGRSLTREQSKFIAESAYIPPQKTVAIDEKRLYTATRQWIKFVFNKERNGN